MLQVESNLNRTGAPLVDVRPVVSADKGVVTLRLLAEDGRSVRVRMERGGALSIAKQLQFAAVKKAAS
jgi:hypothetical protein